MYNLHLKLSQTYFLGLWTTIFLELFLQIFDLLPETIESILTFPMFICVMTCQVEDTCSPWEFCKLQINICPMTLLNWCCFSFVHIRAGRKSNQIWNSCKFRNATRRVSFSHMVQFCCQLWTWFSHFFSFLSETLQYNMCGNVESTRLEKLSF